MTIPECNGCDMLHIVRHRGYTEYYCCWNRYFKVVRDITYGRLRKIEKIKECPKTKEK